MQLERELHFEKPFVSVVHSSMNSLQPTVSALPFSSGWGFIATINFILYYIKACKHRWMMRLMLVLSHNCPLFIPQQVLGDDTGAHMRHVRGLLLF